MDFEWDANKSRSNFSKHGVEFAEAQQIFEGIVFSRIDERKEYGETRHISIGSLGEGLVLLVAHTTRGSKTRLISARKANKREEEIYYEYIEKTFERNKSH